MSQDNVEIVRRSFEAYLRGDLNAAFEDAEPDFVTYRAEPDGATFRGKDGFLQALAEWVDAFDEFTVTPEEFIDADDRVLVQVHQTAIGAQSGAPIEADFWFVYTLRDARTTRLDMLASKAQALEAAGLQE